MKRKLSAFLALIICVSLCICFGIEPNQTKEEDFTASELIESINIGWNLGDALGSSAKDCGYDAYPDLETKWGNPKVSKELIDYVKSLGFNTIRIPVSWCYNCGRDDDGHIQIGQEWMNRVHEVIDYAMENDMYVILNTMCDSWELFFCGVESEEQWNLVQQDAKDLWTQIADSFQDYNTNLIFESYNELDNIVTGWTYSDLSATQMNTLNQIFVDSVRSTGGNNSERILMVPTLFDSTKTNITDAFVLPQDEAEDKLLVTVHCYEEEFDQDIEWLFQTIEDFSNRINTPILIGEFGARDDYMLKEWRLKFTSNYVARAAAHGLKCCVWDDGYHWKIIDRYNFENTDLDLVQALMDGTAGIAYETDTSEKLVFDNMEHFYFGGLNLHTGVVTLVDYQTNYWASLTTKTTDDAVLPIQDGDYIAITEVAKNEAVDFWIYGIIFLDQDQNPISYAVSKNISHKYLCAQIPEGAAYYAINTYDPYHNFKLNQVEAFLAQGDLKLTITFVDFSREDQLEQINLIE